MFKAKARLFKIVLFGKTFLAKNLLLKTILLCFVLSVSIYADSQFNIDIENARLVSDNTNLFVFFRWSLC